VRAKYEEYEIAQVAEFLFNGVTKMDDLPSHHRLSLTKHTARPVAKLIRLANKVRDDIEGWENLTRGELEDRIIDYVGGCKP